MGARDEWIRLGVYVYFRLEYGFGFFSAVVLDGSIRNTTIKFSLLYNKHCSAYL